MASPIENRRPRVAEDGIVLGTEFIPRTEIYSASVIDRRRLPLLGFFSAGVAGAGWLVLSAGQQFPPFLLLSSGLVGAVGCLLSPPMWVVHVATARGRREIIRTPSRQEAHELTALLLDAPSGKAMSSLEKSGAGQRENAANSG
ncbi:MAG TPA: DUF6232 family protein [Chthoniobacterales bacterium]